MPAVILHTSATCTVEIKQEIAKTLSEICATTLGKPEEYMLSMVYDDPVILFGGRSDKSALIEVRSIGGLSSEINQTLSAAICELLSEKLDIDPAHVYLNFIDVERSNWGWNKETF